MSAHTKRLRRIQRDDLKGATHIEVEVYYTKGSRRGYYIVARPVTVKNGMVCFDPFSGRRKLLLETSRFSAKQFEKAVEMARSYEDELIAAVIAENQAA